MINVATYLERDNDVVEVFFPLEEVNTSPFQIYLNSTHRSGSVLADFIITVEGVMTESIVEVLRIALQRGEIGEIRVQVVPGNTMISVVMTQCEFFVFQFCCLEHLYYPTLRICVFTKDQ